MSKILLLNAGSSSVKWKLFSQGNEAVIAKGLVERIGQPKANFAVTFAGQTMKEEIANLSYEQAAQLIIEKLATLKIAQLEEITAVGHRVVAGGMKFRHATLVTKDVLAEIVALKDHAPLHNPMEAKYIELMQGVMPRTPQYAVFDSQFYTYLPEMNAIFSIPYEYTKKYEIRRYGEHGISHTYLLKRTAELLNKPAQDLKLITLHLGSGSSVAAIKDGRAFDTSMGFTPLTGLTMGTRGGDLDPSLVPFLMEKLNLSASEVLDIFNSRSGLLGLTEKSDDMRDIVANQADPQFKLALDIFVNRIVKYVGSYMAELGGLDALVVSGGIGENNPWLRQALADKLSFLGLKIDSQVNESIEEGIISPEDATFKFMVVPTNEELEMVRQIKAQLA